MIIPVLWKKHQIYHITITQSDSTHTCPTIRKSNEKAQRLMDFLATNQNIVFDFMWVI